MFKKLIIYALLSIFMISCFATSPTNVKSSDASASTEFNKGQVQFCRAASQSENKFPGDTAWGIIPNGSPQRGCGCNGGSSSGFGMYYGGVTNAPLTDANSPRPKWAQTNGNDKAYTCNKCGCQGGGWGGYAADGSEKGRGAHKGMRMQMWVRKSSPGAEEWNGNYGGNWKDLDRGWNDLTLRYDHTVGEVQLFVNGRPKGMAQHIELSGSNTLDISSIGGSYDGHIGLAYAYQAAVANDDIEERANLLNIHLVTFKEGYVSLWDNDKECIKDEITKYMHLRL